MAIGDNSVATQPNTVSFGGGTAGTRRLTNVAAGNNNTDAANFGQVRKAYSGVAMAFAQTAVSPTLATGEQSITLGGGVFESQGGFALKYEARPARQVVRRRGGLGRHQLRMGRVRGRRLQVVKA